MIDLPYIQAFLRRPGIEGPQQLKGYVPCNKTGGGTANYRGAESGSPGGFSAMGASGVTIATGADLGQTTRATLVGYGLDPYHADLFTPYYGLKRDDALIALYKRPLTIGRDTAEALDTTLHAGYLTLVAARYDRDNPATPFADLPRQAQAVIFSYLYQRGAGGGPRNAKNTWAALLRGDWADASARFCNAGLWDGYHGRRAMEGKLLLEVV